MTCGEHLNFFVLPLETFPLKLYLGCTKQHNIAANEWTLLLMLLRFKRVSVISSQ